MAGWWQPGSLPGVVRQWPQALVRHTLRARWAAIAAGRQAGQVVRSAGM